ncbi:MAG: hypothetical protein ACLTNP_07510 [Streptococcus salivarius]
MNKFLHSGEVQQTFQLLTILWLRLSLISTDNYAGRNIWFGVREFAMAAAMNGIALHGGTRVYGGTFFVFSNYLLPAVRMAALQNPVTCYDTRFSSSW